MTRRRRHDVIRFLGLCCLAIGVGSLCSSAGGEASHHGERPDAVYLGGRSEIVPDGTRAVFVKVTVDAEKDDYLTSLWVVPSAKAAGAAEPRRLTNGPRDSSPRWSPDGSRMVFVRPPRKTASRSLHSSTCCHSPAESRGC